MKLPKPPFKNSCTKNENDTENSKGKYKSTEYGERDCLRLKVFV